MNTVNLQYNFFLWVIWSRYFPQSVWIVDQHNVINLRIRLKASILVYYNFLLEGFVISLMCY